MRSSAELKDPKVKQPRPLQQDREKPDPEATAQKEEEEAARKGKPKEMRMVAYEGEVRKGVAFAPMQSRKAGGVVPPTIS